MSQERDLHVQNHSRVLCVEGPLFHPSENLGFADYT